MSGQVFSQNARIDIATNFASFDSIDFSVDFPDFLDGDLRPRHLLTLIHEATHHWCLITPVGTALAARTFRTYHDALYIVAESRGAAPYRHERQGPLDKSIWASRTLTSFFVPLLEGLALYAEWRACPREGGTFSRPFDLFQMLVAGNDFPVAHEDARSSGAGTVTGVADERTPPRDPLDTEEARRADARLVFKTVLEFASLRRDVGERRRLKWMLKSSIDPRDGSYQLGYLFVCAIETLCDAHANSDMLLAFLRDHFFGDLALAELILDEELPPEDLYSKVRERLQEKVFQLVMDPLKSAEMVRRWGAGTGFAPVTRSTVDDFFGRPPPSADDQQAYEQYSTRLVQFCQSVGSEIVSAETLMEFLVGGRVLMPLGSTDVVSAGVEGARQMFETDEGVRIGIATAELGEIPDVGDAVTITMMVNVASPGLIVSLRWGDCFEAIALGDDHISKPFIEQVYRQSKQIGNAVEAGQSLIGKILRVVGDASEPIEAFVDEHLAGKDAAMDILQIYRAAIAHAFSEDDAPMKDQRWRTEVFKAWQPSGVSTALADLATFEDFVQICGMPVTFRIDREHLLQSGAAGGEAGIQAISDELFAAVNGLTRARYDDIAERAMSMFERKGLTLFGTSSTGTRVSLI